MFFVPLILGACTALIALFIQTPFAETSTVSGIVFLTFLEETIRFLLLLLSVARAVFSKNISPIIAGILFGCGFASTESFLLESPDPVHIFLLFFVHIALSTLTLFLLSSPAKWKWILAYTTALILHVGYNIAVF